MFGIACRWIRMQIAPVWCLQGTCCCQPLCKTPCHLYSVVWKSVCFGSSVVLRGRTGQKEAKDILSFPWFLQKVKNLHCFPLSPVIPSSSMQEGAFGQEQQQRRAWATYTLSQRLVTDPAAKQPALSSQCCHFSLLHSHRSPTHQGKALQPFGTNLPHSLSISQSIQTAMAPSAILDAGCMQHATRGDVFPITNKSNTAVGFKEEIRPSLPFCISAHFVCFQIYFSNLSPSLYNSSRPPLHQPRLSSPTDSFLHIKSVQI